MIHQDTYRSQNQEATREKVQLSVMRINKETSASKIPIIISLDSNSKIKKEPIRHVGKNTIKVEPKKIIYKPISKNEGSTKTNLLILRLSIPQQFLT